MQFPCSRTTASLAPAEAKIIESYGSIVHGSKTLVSSCMTDPGSTLTASLGGCGGPAWRGLFAEEGTSARISAHLTQLHACFGFTSINKLHNSVEPSESQLELA